MGTDGVSQFRQFSAEASGSDRGKITWGKKKKHMGVWY